jgi:predicted Rossmann-fold nucleotide-binding protein
MRIVVTGGRNFDDERLVDRALSAVHRKHGIDLLIQGEAPGADTLCKRWAKAHGIPTSDMAADWDNIERPGAVVRRRRDGKLYDAAAGGVRNQQMIDEGKPDAAVAFPGGRGTADMVARLRRHSIPVWLTPTE